MNSVKIIFLLLLTLFHRPLTSGCFGSKPGALAATPDSTTQAPPGTKTDKSAFESDVSESPHKESLDSATPEISPDARFDDDIQSKDKLRRSIKRRLARQATSKLEDALEEFIEEVQRFIKDPSSRNHRTMLECFKVLEKHYHQIYALKKLDSTAYQSRLRQIKGEIHPFRFIFKANFLDKEDQASVNVFTYYLENYPCVEDDSPKTTRAQRNKLAQILEKHLNKTTPLLDAEHPEDCHQAYKAAAKRFVRIHDRMFELFEAHNTKPEFSDKESTRPRYDENIDLLIEKLSLPEMDDLGHCLTMYEELFLKKQSKEHTFIIALTDWVKPHPSNHEVEKEFLALVQKIIAKSAQPGITAPRPPTKGY